MTDTDMTEQISSSFLGPLLKQHYGVTLSGEPQLLHGQSGQRVFKARLSSGEALTVRLCKAGLARDKVLGGTQILVFLGQTDFPAPHLRMTLEGEPLFEWQPGAWAYAQEYIEGELPFVKPETPTEAGPLLDLKTMAEVGRMLGRLHKMATSLEDYPVAIDWLEDWSLSIQRAERMAATSVWSRQAAEVAQNLSTLPMAELKALPYALLHTDVHEENLIRTSEGQLYILDWELAGLGEAIIDLGLVLGWLCTRPVNNVDLEPAQPAEFYSFDEEYCRALLHNYQQERTLAELERRMLGPMIRFLMGWYAARDMERELHEPGVGEGLAIVHWAIMRSVTPHWAATLTDWATETATGL